MRPTHWLDSLPLHDGPYAVEDDRCGSTAEIKSGWAILIVPEAIARGRIRSPTRLGLSINIWLRASASGESIFRRWAPAPGSRSWEKTAAQFSHRGALSFELERLGYPGAAGSPAAPRC